MVYWLRRGQTLASLQSDTSFTSNVEAMLSVMYAIPQPVYDAKSNELNVKAVSSNSSDSRDFWAKERTNVCVAISAQGSSVHIPDSDDYIG